MASLYLNNLLYKYDELMMLSSWTIFIQNVNSMYCFVIIKVHQ